MVRAAALILVLGLTATPAAAALNLRCDGVATYPEMESTSASVTGDVTLHGSTSRVVAGSTRDRVLLQVADDQVRVRLPRAMVPPINSGGEDGWWPLSDVKVTDTEITGRFRLNPFNKPTVRVDRVSGDIEVQGSSS